jgi:hypothetical protein
MSLRQTLAVAIVTVKYEEKYFRIYWNMGEGL